MYVEHRMFRSSSVPSNMNLDKERGGTERVIGTTFLIKKMEFTSNSKALTIIITFALGAISKQVRAFS